MVEAKMKWFAKHAIIILFFVFACIFGGWATGIDQIRSEIGSLAAWGALCLLTIIIAGIIGIVFDRIFGE
jgi:hypothetical protein